MEESDFAKLQRSYHSGKIEWKSFMNMRMNWTSARQYDFNSTMIEYADDFSKTIGNAWIKRLPKEKLFAKENLLQETRTSLPKLLVLAFTDGGKSTN